jgi:hypothetical protein
VLDRSHHLIRSALDRNNALPRQADIERILHESLDQVPVGLLKLVSMYVRLS